MDCLAQAQAQARPLKSRLGFRAAAGPPLVTYVLIGLNVAVFLLAPLALGDGWQGYLGLWPGATPDLIAQYINVGDEWYRWITAGFVHFGLFHIAMNMFALFQLGQALEPAMGRLRFIGL
ncbi:MAG: rhomboid family intramembrane serine protease, partial [Demequina sp.]